jgi:hypothetical protein
MNLRKWTRIIIIVLSVATYLVTLGLEYDAYRIDLRTTQAQKELRRKAAIAELERRSVQAGGEIKEPLQVGKEGASLVFDPIAEGAQPAFDPIAEGATEVPVEVSTPDIFDKVATEQLQKQKSPHFFEYLSQGTLIATGIVVALWIVYLILFWLIIWFYKASNRQKRIRVLWLGISIFVLIGLFPPNQRGYSTNFEFVIYNKISVTEFLMLLIMWSIVVAITCGLLYTLKDKKPKDN